MTFNWTDILTGFCLSLLTGVIVLLRKVFTSEAKIKALEDVLANMNDDMERRDDKLDARLSTIEGDIKNLIRR